MPAELGEGRRLRAIVQNRCDPIDAACRRIDGRVDLKVVDPRHVDLALPAQHRVGHWIIGLDTHIVAFTPGLSDGLPPHDLLDRAPHADQPSRQSGDADGHLGEDPEGLRVRVVMSDVDDDVQTQSTVHGDRVVERGEELGDEFFEIRSLILGPSNRYWMTSAMLDFPDRGAPFSTMMMPRLAMSSRSLRFVRPTTASSKCAAA